VNDVLISAELLSRRFPGIAVARMLADHELKRDPIRATEPGGAKVAVVPDAFLELHIESRYRMCIALEYDRGTEEQKRWRSKVAAVRACIEAGTYQERFSTSSLTVAVVTSAGAKRVADLMRWTELELGDRPALHDVFRFTSADPTPEFFLDSCWRRPFAPDHLSLIQDYDSAAA
jgi:hypothetical protein